MTELTPEEKQKIYAEEKIRLEAQEELINEKKQKNTKNVGIGCLTIIMIIVLIYFISVLFPSKSSPRKENYTADIKNKIESQINEAFSNGVIKKLDVQTSRAWISEITWAIVDSQTKEGIARNLALYFSVQKNSEYQEANIIGWQSGKKIASYTSFGGFKVY